MNFGCRLHEKPYLRTQLKAVAMNIFGAFTFGSLIKTFLPGFVWLVAIVMLEAGISSRWPP